MLSPNLATHFSVDIAPTIIKKSHRLLPKFIQGEIVMLLIHRLSHEFYEDGDLDFMDDKVARVSCPDIDLNWFFTKKPGAPICFLDQCNEEKVDVIFSGDLSSFVLMASQSVDPDTLFFNRSLKIERDTELGLEIKNLIDQFDLQDLPSPLRFILKRWARLLMHHQAGD